MKTSEMLTFLEKVMETYGDVDIVVEINDYSDCYNVRTNTSKIDTAIATSELSTISSSREIRTSNEIRLITNIGK